MACDSVNCCCVYSVMLWWDAAAAAVEDIVVESTDDDTSWSDWLLSWKQSLLEVTEGFTPAVWGC